MALFEFMNQGGTQAPGNQGAGNGTENITANSLREILGDLVTGFNSAARNILTAVKYAFTSFGTSVQEISDGALVVLNSAGAGDTRIAFGGIAGTNPAIGRDPSASGLRVLLANSPTTETYIRASTFISGSGAVAVGGAEVSYGATTATTVGAAGGASALPATPVGYLIINVGGTNMKLPYYNN